MFQEVILDAIYVETTSDIIPHLVIDKYSDAMYLHFVVYGDAPFPKTAGLFVTKDDVDTITRALKKIENKKTFSKFQLKPFRPINEIQYYSFSIDYSVPWYVKLKHVFCEATIVVTVAVDLSSGEITTYAY